jgi:hypothetical protein
MTASTPSLESSRVRDTVLEVEWLPAPTITLSFPLQRATALWVSSAISSSARVGDSPVVPATTMPSVPSRM